MVEWNELDEFFGPPPEINDQHFYPCDECCGNEED